MSPLCRIFEAFDFKACYVSLLITGSQTGGKICSNVGLQSQACHLPTYLSYMGQVWLCHGHNCVGRMLNWNWPPHFPSQMTMPRARFLSKLQPMQPLSVVPRLCWQWSLSQSGLTVPYGFRKRKGKGKQLINPGNMLRMGTYWAVQIVS